MAANDVHSQQPLLFIQPSSTGHQGFLNFAGSLIPNIGHSHPQFVNTNSETGAMSDEVQRYAVMFNQLLAIPQTETQEQTATPEEELISGLQQFIDPNASGTDENSKYKEAK